MKLLINNDPLGNFNKAKIHLEAGELNVILSALNAAISSTEQELSAESTTALENRLTKFKKAREQLRLENAVNWNGK